MTDRIGPQKTIDGREAVVFCSTARGEYPLIGMIKNKDADDPACWTRGGRFVSGKDFSSSDLRFEDTDD